MKKLIMKKIKDYFPMGKEVGAIYSANDEVITDDGNIGCPEEVAEHLAGYEVSQDPSKGAQPKMIDPLDPKSGPLCTVCYHHHKPIKDGGTHLD